MNQHIGVFILLLSALSATCPLGAQAGGPPGHVLSTGTLLSPILGPTWTTEETNRPKNLEAAVLAAQPEAALVLDGQPASDLFLSGREALEELSGVALASDVDAAMAILAYGSY